MSVARALVRLAVSCVCVSCAAELQDTFQVSDYRLPFDQKLRREIGAPVIVSGRVTDVTDIGRSRSSPGDPRIRAQLTRIRLDVEQLVKGEIRSNPLDFYYFTYAGDNRLDLGVPRYIPRTGQRRVFFLAPTGEAYRSVGDIIDFTLQVRTGTHPRDFCRGKDPGRCVSELLLVPGKGLDAASLAAYLVQAEYAAEILLSPAEARGMLRPLAGYPDQLISRAAREVSDLPPYPVRAR